MPDKDGRYLVVLDDAARTIDVMYSVYYFEGDKGSYGFSDELCRVDAVTHWMPLPAPPQTDR
jgi:hypothetical protein